MKIQQLTICDFKGFEELQLDTEGKSVVLFGINGTGKSTILAAVNYLFWNWIYRVNNTQSIAFRNITEDMIRGKKKTLFLSAVIFDHDEQYALQKHFSKLRTGDREYIQKGTVYNQQFSEMFLEKYVECENNLPIFVNYGTNRAVLDIPLRIKQSTAFSRINALDRALDHRTDFKSFFEWFRNQEDMENEYKVETGELGYRDLSLQCVRLAIQKMLGDTSTLRVRRSPLRMTVQKDGVEIRVDQLSDGEKCTLALFGDLARRIALANPYRENPLEGEGIVLIDEIELHMHPLWQRKVLAVLKEVFPNIQFIITTHSPQVLGEVDDSYVVYKLSRDQERKQVAVRMGRMDGFDSNYILETMMGTDCQNAAFKELCLRAYQAISEVKFDEAETLMEQIAGIAGLNSVDYIKLEGFLKRSRVRYETDYKR